MLLQNFASYLYRQLKRDRATILAVFPNTTIPPDFPYVKGEGEGEKMYQIDVDTIIGGLAAL